MAINKKLDEASMTSMITGFLANKKDSMQKRNKKNSKNSRMEKFWSNINESLKLMSEAKDVQAKDPETGELKPATVVSVSGEGKDKKYKVKWKDESKGESVLAYKDITFTQEKPDENKPRQVMSTKGNSGSGPKLADETDAQEIGVPDPSGFRNKLPNPKEGEEIEKNGFSDEDKTPVEAEVNTKPEGEMKNKHIMTGAELRSRTNRRLRSLMNSDPKFKSIIISLHKAATERGDNDAAKKLASIRGRIAKDIMSQTNATTKNSSAAGLSGNTNQEVIKRFLTPIAQKIISKVVSSIEGGEKIDTATAVLFKDIFGLDLRTKNSLKAMLSKFNGKEVTPESVQEYVNLAMTPGNFKNVAKFLNSRLDVYPGEYVDEIESFANKENIPGQFEDRANGIGASVKKIMAPNVKKYLGEPEKKDEEKEDPYKDVQGKSISRARVGDTPVSSLSNMDPNQIAKLYSYFRSNQPEIERASKERITSKPILSANPKLSEPGAQVDKLSTIGSEFEQGIFSPDEAKKFPENPDKKDLEDIWSRIINIKARKDSPEKPSDFSASPIAKKLAEYGAKTFSTKEDPVSPYDVMLVLTKMIERDKMGRVVGLKSPEESDIDHEDAVLATQLYYTLNKDRLNKSVDEKPAKEGEDAPVDKKYLGPALSDFGASEAEKVSKNLPKLQSDVLKKQADQAKRDQQQTDQLKAERAKRISPEEIKSVSDELAMKRMKHHGGLKRRRAELSDEESKLSGEVKSALGMDPEFYDDMTNFLNLSNPEEEGDFEARFSPKASKKGGVKWKETIPEKAKEARKFNKQREAMKAALETTDKDSKFSNVTRNLSMIKARIRKLNKELAASEGNPELQQKIELQKQKLEKIQSTLMRPVPVNSFGATDPLVGRVDSLQKLPSMSSMYTPGVSRFAKPSPSDYGPKPGSGKLAPPAPPKEKEREDAYQLATGDIGGEESSPRFGGEEKPKENETPEQEQQRLGRDKIRNSKIVSNPSFIPDKESRKNVQKRLFVDLVKQARKRAALKNEPLTPTYILSTIKAMYERGKLPKIYDELRPMIEKMSRKDLDPNSTMPIVEFLTLPGKKKLVHADVKNKDWSSANPAIKLKFDPKFEKQTKPNTKKKKAKGKTK